METRIEYPTLFLCRWVDNKKDLFLPKGFYEGKSLAISTKNRKGKNIENVG
ncbi:hypothetical protein [Bacillus paranthracis]|uniref:hypothetical protein n=1 Tax=Bacillus paranthracis TaxID=2026186 RepID=UPI002FDBEE30